MSSTSWDINLVAILNNTTSQINRYFSLFIFIFGIIGNILNVLVLSQRTFRTNSCALFFLVSSIANIITTVGGLTSRMLTGWAVDLTNTIGWLCKLRIYIVWVSRTLAMWSIALAAVDRWLLTSADNNRRQMSKLKNAYRGMIIILTLSALFYIQLFICIDANIMNAPSKCYAKNPTCRLVSDFSNAIVTNIIPILLMLLFGLKTVSNVRHSRQRIDHQIVLSTEPKMDPTSNLIQRTKKVDRYMVITLLIQVVVLSILMLPSAIQRIYATLTLNYNKSALQNAIENLIFSIVLLAIYIGSGVPFYIYTLCGGKLFRTATWTLMKQIVAKMKC